MNDVNPSLVQKKKGSWVKKIAIGVILFSVFIIIISAIAGSSQTPTTSTNQVSTAIFDVPSLVGKDLTELIADLGTPDENTEPTPLQTEHGTKTWEKAWKRDGYSLLATHDTSSTHVVDLFLGADSDAVFEKFKDTDNILKAGNLTQTDSQYSVEFVKAKNASGYTGAIVREK